MNVKNCIIFFVGIAIATASGAGQEFPDCSGIAGIRITSLFVSLGGAPTRTGSSLGMDHWTWPTSENTFPGPTPAGVKCAPDFTHMNIMTLSRPGGPDPRHDLLPAAPTSHWPLPDGLIGIPIYHRVPRPIYDGVPKPMPGHPRLPLIAQSTA
jgi:hypothetical protein